MKHAIISLGGKQFNVQENDLIQVPGNTGLNPVVFFYNDGKTSHIGEPALKDFHIKLTVVEEKKGEKVAVKRFKAKSRYKKNHGHRQGVIVVKVLELGEAKEAKKEEKTEKAEMAEVTEPKKREAVAVKPASKATPAKKTVKETKKTK